jgi:hypothetical protein
MYFQLLRNACTMYPYLMERERMFLYRMIMNEIIFVCSLIIAVIDIYMACCILSIKNMDLFFLIVIILTYLLFVFFAINIVNQYNTFRKGIFVYNWDSVIIIRNILACFGMDRHHPIRFRTTAGFFTYHPDMHSYTYDTAFIIVKEGVENSFFCVYEFPVGGMGPFQNEGGRCKRKTFSGKKALSSYKVCYMTGDEAMEEIFA